MEPLIEIVAEIDCFVDFVEVDYLAAVVEC
jgi:hypothetical protein